MKIIRGKDISFIPAGHEDKENPEVWKKVLFKKDELINGRVQMINWAKLPVGKTFKAHFHEDMEEVFIILNGKVKIFVGQKEEELEKGDAVLIPIRAVHKMKNISKNNVTYIAIGITYGKGGKTVLV
ncbi:MAG: cupin domain-containing protein [bacterium]|nr:cupin domain-containing protein [bacterium]